MTDFLFRHLSWFDQCYAKHLDLDGYSSSRAPTFKAALSLLLYRNGRTIIETGCQRGEDDWGAGCSTKLLCEFVSREGGRLTSIDIDKRNVEFASSNFSSPPISCIVCSDSVEFLNSHTTPIDLLYLDSYDYPIVEICDLYGPREEYSSNLTMLDRLGEKEFINRHGDMVLPSQEHCLEEIKASSLCLHSKSIVLIDDSGLPGGGKARLARQWLLDNDWIVLLDAYQTLWVKKESMSLQ